jgi:hypothetical protein
MRMQICNREMENYGSFLSAINRARACLSQLCSYPRIGLYIYMGLSILSYEQSSQGVAK